MVDAFQTSRHNVLSIMDMDDSDKAYPIIAFAALLSALAYYTCVQAIPGTKNVLRDRGIYGIDINKITAKGMDRFREERKTRVMSKFSDDLKKLLMYEIFFLSIFLHRKRKLGLFEGFLRVVLLLESSRFPSGLPLCCC